MSFQKNALLSMDDKEDQQSTLTVSEQNFLLCDTCNNGKSAMWEMIVRIKVNTFPWAQISDRLVGFGGGGGWTLNHSAPKIHASWVEETCLANCHIELQKTCHWSGTRGQIVGMACRSLIGHSSTTISHNKKAFDDSIPMFWTCVPGTCG